MFKRCLASAVVAASVATLAWAAADTGWRDVLDTPAAEEPAGATQRWSTAWPAPASASWPSASAAMCCCPTTRARPGARPRCRSAPTWWRWRSRRRPRAGPSATTAWCCAAPTPAPRWTRVLDGRQAGAADGRTTTSARPRLPRCRARAAALLKEAERFAAQGAENPFLDVGFENAKTGYLVGAFGLIFRTTDGGATWQPLLHATDNPQGPAPVRGARVGGEVYIAGEQGLMLKLDRGAGRSAPSSCPTRARCSASIGNDRAVLVHGLRGTVLRSTDAGRSWQAVNTGLQVGLTGQQRSTRRAASSSSARPAMCWSAATTAPVSRWPRSTNRCRPRPWSSSAHQAVVVGGPRGVSPLTLQ